MALVGAVTRRGQCRERCELKYSLKLTRPAARAAASRRVCGALQNPDRANGCRVIRRRGKLFAVIFVWHVYIWYSVHHVWVWVLGLTRAWPVVCTYVDR